MDEDAKKKFDELKKRLLRDASEVGCFGLVDGVAIQLKTGNRVSARSSVKADGPFVCSRCWTPAVVHKDRGGGRLEHFAHNAPLTPIIPHGETATHRNAKYEIKDALAALWPDGKWEVERPIPKNEEEKLPEVVPDVSGRISKQRLVIEIQWSTLTVATILRRSITYWKRNIPILWILPLERPLTGEFRPRSFERYLHSMYFGRVYYWCKGDGHFVRPTHFTPVERWVDTREWVDAGGEQSAGGYPKKLRVLKTAHSQPAISISDHFQSDERGEFTPWNEKRKIPTLLLWQDKLTPWWLVDEEEEARREWEREDEQVFERHVSGVNL